MIAELGHFALLLALMTSIVQATLPLFGAHRIDRGLMALGSYAGVSSFLLVAISFACLAYSFVISDFSVLLVAANSQIAKPLIYKITGVWANHEGSMMLWVLILVIFAAAIAVFGHNLPETLKARVLAIQGMIATAFLAFVIFTSNPFLRLANPPLDGNGMNPILQDPGLAIHPPCLYVGYVGFSVAFAFAVAALIEGKVVPSRPFYFASQGPNDVASVFNKEWKLHVNRNGFLELYDLKVDWYETANVADLHPEVIRQLQNALSEYQAKANLAAQEYLPATGKLER